MAHIRSDFSKLIPPTPTTEQPASTGELMANAARTEPAAVPEKRYVSNMLGIHPQSRFQKWGETVVNYLNTKAVGHGTLVNPVKAVFGAPEPSEAEKPVPNYSKGLNAALNIVPSGRPVMAPTQTPFELAAAPKTQTQEEAIPAGGGGTITMGGRTVHLPVVTNPGHPQGELVTKEGRPNYNAITAPFPVLGKNALRDLTGGGLTDFMNAVAQYGSQRAAVNRAASVSTSQAHNVAYAARYAHKPEATTRIESPAGDRENPYGFMVGHETAKATPITIVAEPGRVEGLRTRWAKATSEGERTIIKNDAAKRGIKPNEYQN